MEGLLERIYGRLMFYEVKQQLTVMVERFTVVKAVQCQLLISHWVKCKHSSDQVCLQFGFPPRGTGSCPSITEECSPPSRKGEVLVIFRRSETQKPVKKEF